MQYAPSVTTFHVLRTTSRGSDAFSARLLGVGGVPYESTALAKPGLVRGFGRGTFADLPLSTDEVRIAQSLLRARGNKLLLGASATESAFKQSDLDAFRIIHLAVHGIASTAFPDRAALILLSDPAASEDGFLQAPEIVQLRLNAALVVLSACETAVGPLQGQEGVANLSRAFLLAGAQSVVSTLWPVNEDASLFLMRRFFRNACVQKPPAVAMAEAKREFLRSLGARAVPYLWAAFTVEGGPVDRVSDAVRPRKAQ